LVKYKTATSATSTKRTIRSTDPIFFFMINILPDRKRYFVIISWTIIALFNHCIFR
jgi:hypothetical protein